MSKVLGAVLGAMLFLSARAFAQTVGTDPAQKPAGQNGGDPAALAEKKPKVSETINVMRGYRGIQLGMQRDEVHKALGKPERREDTWDEFKLEKDDLMTVRYDNDVVNIIQLYFTDAERAPEFAEVVGDIEITPKNNGARFARNVIAAEKFWVSMYQSGDKKITTVTIRR